MRGFLFLEMQVQGKKRSKIGHLARLFNAADAFSGAKSIRKSNCQDTLRLLIQSMSGLDVCWSTIASIVITGTSAMKSSVAEHQFIRPGKVLD
ncbi:hypothetical protein LVJ83_04040 [Uruburuella testudinis]|uniref:Uncharacterized protein n=1 Tax=Uruburuella testudinis TaxID=1282863 RepID=A0ABY4DUB9_9NEIS|nr:hypothetical protein [Uruburuella testudinis]UOO82640.1 hypothetical protein LVJ83_04040 [Uruburuella testudinis]